MTITRKDIDDLHDAYRKEEGLVSSLKWCIQNREEIRERLHKAHEQVTETQVALSEATAERQELERKVGVKT